MLFLGREIKSRLDLLKPDLVKIISDRLHKSRMWFNDRHYEPGEIVAVRSYKSPNKKWVIGKIVAKDGILNYTVNVEGELCRRHTNQIRTVGSNVECSGPKLRHSNVTRQWVHNDDKENQQKAHILPKRDACMENDVQTNKSSTVPTEVDSPTNIEQIPDVQQDISADLSCSLPISSQPVRRSSRNRRPPNRLNL